MTNLLLHVTPELQVDEGALKVAFFDKEIIRYKPNPDPDAPKEEVSREIKLCIRIENKEDGYSIIERPSTKIRLISPYGESYMKEEKEIYKKAYATYLAAKEKPVFNTNSELEIARKRIAELEANFEKEAKKATKVKKEIKLELPEIKIEPEFEIGN